MEFYPAFHGIDFAVPLGIPLGTGNAIKETEPHFQWEPAFNSIISIRACDGSGVVISKRDTPIIVSARKIGSLALTAGHIIGCSLLRNGIAQMFIHNSESNISASIQKYVAFTLKDYSSFSETL